MNASSPRGVYLAALQAGVGNLVKVRAATPPSPNPLRQRSYRLSTQSSLNQVARTFVPGSAPGAIAAAQPRLSPVALPAHRRGPLSTRPAS